MEGERTKIAPAETPPVACYGKAQFRDCRHAAFRLVGRMIIAHVGQCIHPVHLALRERFCGWVLYNIFGILVLFHQALAGKRVGITVLCIKTPCKCFFVRVYFLPGRKLYGIADRVNIFCPVYRPCHKSNIPCRNPCVKCLRNFHNRVFPHTVGEDIRLRIKKNRAAHPVTPVIVMRQPAQ